MKILQVVPYFYPAWSYGGPGKLVYDTSLYFVSQKHSVTIYTSDAFDKDRRMKLSEHLNIKNLKVRYFKNINNDLSYIYNIFITPALFLFAPFDIFHYDVIHIHDFYTLQNLWVAWWARIYKVPYIISVHGCLEENRIIINGFLKNLFLRLFGIGLLHNASYVVATSENEIKAYARYGLTRDKIVLLGHGIVTEEFETTASTLESRKIFKLPDKKIIVTFLGRIHKIKGLDLLVEAAKTTPQEVHFIVAGSDDGFLKILMGMIKKYKLQNKFTRHDVCFGEAKAKLFKATDIFVYPSYSEGFSLGILEMASVGKPLVITTGCHFSLLAKYRAGIIVNPKSKEISAAIALLAKDAKKRKVFGANAKRLIEENYSMSAIGDKLLKIYSKSKLAKHE